MCQLNLVFVKSSKNKQILENNEYNFFEDVFENFSLYCKGYCDCGSFVGSMSEYSGNSYFTMVEDLNKVELEKLNKIKNLMSKSNYKNLKEKYISERDALSNSLEKFNEFIEKNQLMEESTLYFLTKEEEDNYNKLEELPDDELSDALADLTDSDDAVKYIDVPEESFVIDTVIQNLENKYDNDYNAFLEYKNLFKILLENEDYILFCCIWDEPNNLSIEKEVNINALKIEDLACLEYNKLLKISK